MLLTSSVALADDLDSKDSINSENIESTSTKKQTTQVPQTESSEAKTYKLEKVTTTVSTASGYTQDIKYAPASIAVVPKEEILERPVRDVGDAVQDIPGVYVEASKTGANTISMRGLDSSYTLILIDGKRQNVAQGFDENDMSANTSFMPPASMIERIEVIRGPASIIYGSDAMGGVINIITKKNPQKFTASVQLETKLHEKHKTFGNIYGVNFYMAAPIVKDKFSMNLRGKYQYGEQNAFLKPAYILANQTGTNRANPYLGWSATGFQNANLGARFTYTPNTNNTLYLDLDGYFGRLGSLNTSTASITAIRDFYKINGILNYDVDYNWGRINTYLQYSQTFWAPHAGVAVGASSGTSINWASLRDNKDVIFQSTYNNLFEFGKFGELVVNGGVYYLYERFQNKSSNFDRAMNQFAVFAEGGWNINDYIGMTLGLRYNYSDIFKDIPNPRFYINYNPFSWLTFKVGVASGVRTPNLSYLYEGHTESTFNDVTTYVYGNKDLRPETSWSYEVGSIIDTEHIFATLTGYYTDFRDQIETIPFDGDMCSTGSTNVCRTYRNLDKTLMAGAEVGFKLKPIYGFSLDANYGFTYTEVLSYSASGNVGENPVGKPVNSIPKHSFTLTPRYHIALSENHVFDMYLRWSGKFQTPTPTATGTQAGRLDQTKAIIGQYYKDYQIVDIALTYKAFKKYYITFSVNNLFDVDFLGDLVGYSGSGNNLVIGGANANNVINRYQRILPSRNYWITLRVEF
nr:TonB-dependent receptor [Helicobacter saguini]